jgi:uncharacterized protein (TIGR03435 family)
MSKAACVIGILATVHLYAQSPAFEAASIRPSKPESTPSGAVTPGRIAWTAHPLQSCILYAYGVANYQISGGPKWIGTDGFDIAATAPPNTSGAQLRLMLRALLEERFHLAWHREQKQVPAYDLVLGRGGPKFPVEKREMTASDGRIGGGGRGLLGGKAVTAAVFAEYLSHLLDRPVIDQTGIEGVFDFRLSWNPDEMQRAGLSTEGRPAADGAPSLFAALQDQLGLKVIPRKGTIDLFVIDHAEKPSEN